MKNSFQLIQKYHNPLLICIFGIMGFTAASVLSYDKLELLRNPNFVPPCSINLLLDCSSVMKSKYAEIFGIPWSFFGVAGYPTTLLIGLLLLTQNKISKFLAFLVSVGAFAAFILSTVFMFLSAYVLAKFCPWCILSAISSTGIFFSLVIHNLYYNNYSLNESGAIKVQKFISKGWHLPLVILWYIAIVLMAALPFILAQNDIFIFIQ